MVTITDFFGTTVKWADARGSCPEIIFSTRVRFARNFSGFPFPHRAPDSSLLSARRLALGAIKSCGLVSRAYYLETGALSSFEKCFLVERHHISHALAAALRPSGVVISGDESLSVMVNEEDHLRVQSIVSGLAIEEAFSAAEKLESALGRILPYAYSDKFGCLTACPANAGTGLRVSCLAHLPALSLLGHIPVTLESLSSLGVTARGIYGEGTCILGDFYQISSSASLGRSEEEFCRSMERAIKNLINREMSARETLFQAGDNRKTEDAVYRAYGALKYARLMSYQEFMRHISLVRLGLAIGCGFGLDFSALNQLILLMQPAHLQLAGGDPRASFKKAKVRGKQLFPPELDAFRSDCLRKKLGS
ncbi:MAG TPA: ATP--guanido phosphotransferase [Elusimicrobia bacterium]|nr:ATP--guanido phosphotransferase [Elusimicrobiota bacterium]